MKTRRWLAAALCLLLWTGAAGCAGGEAPVEAPDTRRYASLSLSSGDEVAGTVCENAAWRLCWDPDKKRVSFEEKATGLVWGPTPAEACVPVYDEDDMPVKTHPQVESAVLVYYHDPATQDEKVALSATEAVGNGAIYTQKIENGLRVTYDFTELEMAVPVEYTIEEDRFLITVRPETIADNGEQYVTAVALAPFLCGIQNNRADGWLFLPDGAGALIAPQETDMVGSAGMAGVYGEDRTVQTYAFSSVVQPMHMPVYGVKKGAAGLLAVIDSGAEGASLAWNVGAQNIRYSSVYPFFRIRGYSLIEAPRGFVSPLTEIKVFAKEICTVPLRVAGYALSGPSADLAGMARTYRDYLQQYRGLTKRSEAEPAAAFKYVGALMQPGFLLGIPTSKLYPLTTTADAVRMTEELTEALGTDFYVDLAGFGSSGVDVGPLAGGYSAAGVLGGDAGLRRLAEAFADAGVAWYMDFDLISFNRSANGFSKNRDVAVLPNGQAAWYSSYQTVTRMKNNDRFFLLARDRLGDAVDILLDKAAGLRLTGISLDSLSHTVYADYAAAETGVAAGMAADATAAFQAVRQGGYRLLADAANDYAAVSADAILDAPLYSSGYDVSSADVPFYEMVLKGYVPMSAVSINLCADEPDALLRCVEAGISPSFTLTRNGGQALITTQHSIVFGSDFAGNKQRIVETVKGLRNYLDSVEGAAITAHQQLDGGVRVTRFDNGVYAAVNYGAAEAVTDYGTIPPRSYITGRDAA